MPYIFQDAIANKGNFKGQMVTALFRVMQVICRRKITKIIFLPYFAFYKIFVEWFLNIELPYNSTVGKGLAIYHGHSIVINHEAIIGDNCVLRQSITIGNKILSNGDTKSPIIGNNVEIGASSCIIGDINIGDNVTIGAGSVVVKSFPANCVVAGNPARLIKNK